MSKPKIVVKTTMTSNKVTMEAYYCAADLNMETDSTTSAKTEIKICNEFSDVFTGIGCFRGTFSLKVKI